MGHVERLRQKMLARLYRRAERTLCDEAVDVIIRRMDPSKYLEIFGTIFPGLSAADAVEAFAGRTALDQGRQAALQKRVIMECYFHADPENATSIVPGPPLFDEQLISVLSQAELNEWGAEALQTADEEAAADVAAPFPAPAEAGGDVGRSQ